MNLRQIAINTLSQFAGRGVSIAITLGSTLLLRRYLGRNEYGTYIYLTNIVLIGVSLADLGTYLTSVRESSSSLRDKTKVLGESIVLRGLLAFLGGLIVLSLQPILKLPIHSLLIYFSLSLLLNLTVLKESLAMLFHAFEKLYISSFIQTGVSLINLAVVMVVTFLGQSVYTIFWGNILGLLLLTLPLLIYAFSRSLIKPSYDFRAIKSLFMKSIPLGGVLFLFTTYSKLDSFIINHYFGSGAVGVYGIAYKVYDNLTLPAAFLLNALLPEMSRIAGVNNLKLQKLCQRSLGILTGLSFLIILLIYFSAPLIVRVLTGERGIGEVTVLRILSIATLFAYANHVTGYAVIALGAQKKSLIIALIALLFNGFTNFFLLPIYGMYASAVLTIATEALVLVLSGAVVINYLKKQYVD